VCVLTLGPFTHDELFVCGQQDFDKRPLPLFWTCLHWEMGWRPLSRLSEGASPISPGLLQPHAQTPIGAKQTGKKAVILSAHPPLSFVACSLIAPTSPANKLRPGSQENSHKPGNTKPAGELPRISMWHILLPLERLPSIPATTQTHMYSACAHPRLSRAASNVYVHSSPPIAHPSWATTPTTPPQLQVLGAKSSSP